MNTDIYIEFDEALADRVATERLNRLTLDDVAKQMNKDIGKWLVKTGSWRKKCRELRYERPCGIMEPQGRVLIRIDVCEQRVPRTFPSFIAARNDLRDLAPVVLFADVLCFIHPFGMHDDSYFVYAGRLLERIYGVLQHRPPVFERQELLRSVTAYAAADAPG